MRSGEVVADPGESEPMGPTWRKDLRLNESELRSTLSLGGSSVVFDFLRSLCAHENKPFFGEGEMSALFRFELSIVS